MSSSRKDKKDDFHDNRRIFDSCKSTLVRDTSSSHSEAKKYIGSSDNSEDFSFTKCKYDLNKVFSANPNLVQDQEDFWGFVRKYEAVQKKMGKLENPPTSPLKSFGLPANYHKSYCINLKINLKFGELFACVPQTNELDESQLIQFKEVIALYLDFKQNEKFRKLKKLRDSQNNLPVAKYKIEIIESVRNEKVVIIAGDTGCGKSTQVPQFLYSAGFKRIACTQPRRIACISLSKRVAFETLTENKPEVGYQIRFEKQRNQNTRITFITEGLLLRQVSSETGLSQYDVVVLDEVHERHLYGDFLLGIMKCLIHQRKDLKLVLMSATINIKLFKDYFAKEKVKLIQIPGRLYPIQLLYRPVKIDDFKYKNDRFNPSPYVQILQLIDNKYVQSEKGDLLIFLSGMSEITSVVDAAKEYAQKKSNWIILPLHSTLSISEQDKVFDYPPENVRKCIVSTNIAETSITIDGIRFVADSGKVKEISYDPVCKMQKLKEFWISKASAEQRKGRAGRTGPGCCYRMYSEEEYNQLEKYSIPEIQRVSLDSLLLQMMSMGLPDPRKFPFIETPPPQSIENSILSLKEHAAINDNEKLTSIGRALAKLPVDISIGKMLIMGSIFHQVEPTLSVAAALSIQNPFTNRLSKDLDCELSRKKLESDHGDAITLLNAYREWLEIKHENANDSRSLSSRQWCRRRGLEEQRFYEMTKLRGQFEDLLKDCNFLKSLHELDSSKTSYERSLRHGELKLLKSMKRTYKQTSTRKRKQLKVNEFDLQFDRVDDNGIDIKDVEFRMRNDSTKIKNLVDSSTACSYKDLTMLKLILCSGLYPQLAIPDEFNYSKSVSEQLFHTRAKPYVALHPMSFFGNHPQLLQLEEIDIVHLPGFKSKTPISAKHQMIVYLSLLETTKPYLVNTMRMPAAQSFLLFSQNIDTNSVMSIIVCDNWVALEFPLIDSGMNLLMRAVKIRRKWDLLLSKQLQEGSEEIDGELEDELCRDLIEFMNTSIPYTVTRLLAADLKRIYVGPAANSRIMETNPFQEDFQCSADDFKGGIKVNSFITYDCLVENDWSEKLIMAMTETPWECSICGLKMIVTCIEKLKHLGMCGDVAIEESGVSKSSVIGKAIYKEYRCAECRKTLYLTPIDVLKHKKIHKSISPSKYSKQFYLLFINPLKLLATSMKLLSYFTWFISPRAIVNILT